jgi:hypothetical protein
LTERWGTRSFTARLVGIDPSHPDRLSRIASGRARVTDAEARSILEARSNLRMLSQLDRHAQSKGVPESKRDRALVDWLRTAKVQGGPKRGAETAKRTGRVLGILGYDQVDRRMLYKRAAPE